MFIRWLFLFLCIYCASCTTKIINSDGSVSKVEINKEKLSDKYTDLSLEYLKHDAPQLALERANLAISNNRNSYRAYMVRGIVYQNLNKPIQAEDDFKKSLQLKYDYPDAIMNYGIFLCGQERYDEAFTNFNEVLDDPLYLNPELGYYNQGKCYFQKGNLELASNSLMNAIAYKNAPQDSYILLAQLSYNQGNLLIAKYYIDQYNLIQTSATIWLNIQILQSLMSVNYNSSKFREYYSFNNVLVKMLFNNFANSIEAREYISKFGFPNMDNFQ